MVTGISAAILIAAFLFFIKAACTLDSKVHVYAHIAFSLFIVAVALFAGHLIP